MDDADDLESQGMIVFAQFTQATEERRKKTKKENRGKMMKH